MLAFVSTAGISNSEAEEEAICFIERFSSGSTSRVSDPLRKLCRRLASGHAPESLSAGDGAVSNDHPCRDPDGS
jgi:hypothetical protein